MANCNLDSQKILKTINLLQKRIEERFGGSSLSMVCRDLSEVARDSDETIAHIHKNRLGYRIGVLIFVGAVLGCSVFGFSGLRTSNQEMTVVLLLQVLDAVFNIVILVGGAIIFLVSIENRTKRSRVIKAINTLRCLAHVIDSHQLTKDPSYLDQSVIQTTHSPRRNMTAFELGRYLDYCSEMLSLVSKVGFLYVQDYNDPVATELERDLEEMTNGLSRKIWQKIMIIQNERKA
ncbi:MAG: hypothetical protein K9M75_01505 [Phycisphaerae bacterium]|nr:hypothetical protein [Phycisphaerae bacterium]